MKRLSITEQNMLALTDQRNYVDCSGRGRYANAFRSLARQGLVKATDLAIAFSPRQQVRYTVTKLGLRTLESLGTNGKGLHVRSRMGLRGL